MLSTEQLTEALRLPKISGILLAYVKVRLRDAAGRRRELSKLKQQGLITTAEWVAENQKTQDPAWVRYLTTEWKLVLSVPGPDSRFNPGGATLSPQGVISFRQSLREAQDQMQLLAEQTFSGVYKKRIGSSIHPKLEVKAESGQVVMLVWLSSGTFSFSREWNAADVQAALKTLENIEIRAAHLVRSLEALAGLGQA